MQQAARLALSSSCLRSRCGTIIAKNGKVVGEGVNSPPCDEKLERCLKDDIPKDFKSDRTCCVHAEQRAIIQAIMRTSNDLKGAKLYFIRVDENGDLKKAGEPYCTHCSKLAFDSGISEFLLWQDDGIRAWNAKEYNEDSFKYRGD